MQPDRSLLLQTRDNIDIVDAEALAEFFPITATSKHLDQIARQKKQKTDRPKQVVDETNHSIADYGLRVADRNRTSVAP